MKKHFPIIIEQDKNGIYIVECPILKGCRSYGNSIDEAVENIQEAISCCIECEDFLTPETTFVGMRDIEVAVP
jgi:predicted RNase H-like HicB family nuclease